MVTCQPHRTGVPVGMPAFYEPGCPTCEDKRRRGVVTGAEPRPSTFTVARQKLYGREFFYRVEAAKLRREQGP